ncbi:MAG TPA: alpha-E domain-containing protein [Acidimicrobiales bacterium]|nr:alpha-E domain-containing protein [Acidimicrobiales bacterium]
MLSRIAESLYWVGRYVERAEDTARILDVHVHHLLEDPAVDQELACRTLLEVMGVTPAEGATDVAAVSQALAFAPDDRTSIVGALGAARENARGVREAISLEMWECLNAVYLGLPDHLAQANAAGPHLFFRHVKERSAMLAGLADATLSRDDGWRFLVLGRSLERFDMTTRVLAAGFREPSGPSEWITTLLCCSAHEAFLRTYRRAVSPVLVAEFLILDRLFPRSAYHALEVAERCLAELRPTRGRAGLEDEARRIVGRARTELEFRQVAELLSDLPTHLRDLQSAGARAGQAVAERFFRPTSALEWSAAGGWS